MKIEVYPNDWIDTKHIVGMAMHTSTTVLFNEDCQVVINLEMIYGLSRVQRQIFIKEIQAGNAMFRKMLRAWKGRK